MRALLEIWMPEIQRVLDSGGTSPLDFTLHDAEHSFRVAEWMAEITPAEVLDKLSAYELGLLLLSAYLHDIGMTPEQGLVLRCWRHLVFGPAAVTATAGEGFHEEEARELQRWLDEEERAVEPPLARDGNASEEAIRLADELIAHYARHRHNAWSEQWIRRYFGDDRGLYEGWLDDLVQICRSHHQGYDDLKSESFDPRLAGRGFAVHLRYLACVLRVADVLDVDPERTPDVIFRHREIREGSHLFWRKDHQTWMARQGSTLVVSALPESAVVEHAIRRTAEDIRRELEGCARLGRERPFDRSAVCGNLPHRWDFPEAVSLHVRPRADSYVYIEGAFRPNTPKLLELLSGTALYGRPIVAVRELVQNAFDAVKEEVAAARLRSNDPNDPRLVESLAHLHRIELRLEEDADRLCSPAPTPGSA